MTNNIPTTTTSTHENRGALVDLCIAAFTDESVTNWISPQPAERAKYLTAMFTAALATTPTVALTSTNGTLIGVALWQPPTFKTKPALPSGAPPGGALTENQLSQLDPLNTPDLLTTRVHALHEATMQARPAQPHAYLASMAIHPAHRQHGHGATLLQAVLDQAHQVSNLVYLEASNTDNARFYTRHGFHPATAPFTLPGVHGVDDVHSTSLTLFPLVHTVSA